MTSASKPSGKGVQLDPNDPVDRKIMERQQQAAVQAGRDGLDRAAVTRGRPDLEAAYDSGANEPLPGGDQAPAEEKQPKAGGQSKGKRSATGRGAKGSTGPGWKSFAPRSPARLPTRAADAGGFLSGLALYMVVVIYIRYGPEGWKGWLAAKFLNRPMASPTGGTGTKPKAKSGKAKVV